MIFGRRKHRGNAGAAVAREQEEIFEEIEGLERANRESRDGDTERRILRLRHEAGARMVANPPRVPARAEPVFDLLPDDGAPPEIAAGDLTPEIVRAGILRSGALLVRNFISEREAASLVEQIERAIDARAAHNGNGSEAGADAYYEEFEPDPPFGGITSREWVSDSGVWAADSPALMFEMTEAFERSGLRRLVTGYLGERPALSVQKCTLRKVTPDAGNNGWHQDGAFLGDVRALNVWLSLSRCGDEAPGLDLVPRRLEHIVPTGTEGAAFDWSVSPAVAEEVAGDLPIVRPIFNPGDMLLFDDRLLHKTAASTDMPNSRYAVESWFFSPSAFPAEYAPIAY